MKNEDEPKLFDVFDDFLGKDENIEALKEIIKIHDENFTFISDSILADHESLMLLGNVLKESIQELESLSDYDEYRIRHQEMMDSIYSDNNLLIDNDTSNGLSQLVENHSDMVS